MFTTIMEAISTWAIPLVVALVCFWAIIKKVPVYSVFTEGAKEGFSTAVMIIPYLTAMLCAIGMFVYPHSFIGLDGKVVYKFYNILRRSD